MISDKILFFKRKILEFRKNQKSIKIFKHSIFVSAGTLFNNISRFGVIFLLTRYYTKEEFGIWAALTSSLAIAGAGDLGLSNALRNKISFLIVDNPDGSEEARKYFFSIFYFLFILAIILITIYLLLKQFIPFEILLKTNNNYILKEGSKVLSLVISFYLINLPFGLFMASFFSFSESKYYSYFTIFQSLTTLLVIVSLVILSKPIYIIALLYLFTITITNVLGFSFFIKRRKWFNLTITIKEGMGKVKELIGNGIKFMLIQISCSFLQNAGTLLIGSFVGLGVSSEFNLVLKIYNLILGLFQGAFNPLWASYSEAAANKQWVWLRKAIKSTLIITMVFFLSVIITLNFLGDYLIKLLAGEKYHINNFMFFLVGTNILVYALWAVVTLLQNSINKISLMSVTTFIAMVAILILSKYISSYLGVYGIILLITSIWLILFYIHSVETFNIIKTRSKLN